MILWTLSACLLGGGEPEVVEDPPEEELPELELGRVEQPKQPRVLPGTNTGPAAPDEAVTADMCDDMEDGGPVNGPYCITADIQCDETVVGHTIGGTKRFDSRFYDHMQCTPMTTDHDGGDERVYRLQMPEGEWTATVWLDTPCADLDVAGMVSPSADSCPTPTSHVPRCDMWPARRGKREKLVLVSQKPTTWLLVVEGKDDEEGPFALHVVCEEGF